MRAKGTGSVYQTPDGKWHAKATIHGEARYRTTTSRKAADAWIKAEQAKMLPTSYTVRSASDKWMTEHVEPQCRRSTIIHYRQMLDRHLLPALGDRNVEDVRRGDVQAVVSAMAGRKLSQSTMASAKRALHGVYEFLIGLDIVAVNPCAHVKVPAVPAKQRRALNPEQVRVLLDSLETCRWQNAVRFLLVTGLRRGELIGLKWSDIRDGWISIDRSVAPGGEVVPPKTKAGGRRFKLSDAALSVLEDQRDQLRIERIDSQLVFPAQSGASVSPMSLTTIIRDHAAAAGLSMTMHELRHTFATQALAGGLDIKALQAILGHATAAMTLDTYGHIVDGKLEEAAAAVDGFAVRLLNPPRSKVVKLHSIR